MARILVVGDADSLAPRLLLERLVQTMQDDGHDAQSVADVEDVTAEVREADAVVALLDHAPATAVALVAYAHAHRKPVLGCIARGGHLPRAVRAMCSRVVEARRGSDLPPALESFYDEVRPFAGRLVRDRIPELVKEAGHDVRFRTVGQEDLPRFLKRKIVEEAQALDAAAGGREREELADLLEALEAFLAARGVDREDLKRIKAHKHEERGGFTKGFVVESATTGKAAPQDAKDGRNGAKERQAGQAGQAGKTAAKPPAQKSNAKDGKDYDGPVWEAGDAEPAPTHVDALGPDKPVRAELRDL